MPQVIGHLIQCLQCKSEITPKINRDFDRKKFCSRSCLGTYLFNSGAINRTGARNTNESKLKLSIYRKRMGSWTGENNPNFGGVISNVSLMSNENRKMHRARMLNGGASKARKACGGKRSSIQLIVEAFLKGKGILFEYEKMIGNHAVDIFVSPNLCIECDGSYWHSLPEQIQRDLKFSDFCKINGFILIRLKEQEIRNGGFIKCLSF